MWREEEEDDDGDDDAQAFLCSSMPFLFCIASSIPSLPCLSLGNEEGERLLMHCLLPEEMTQQQKGRKKKKDEKSENKNHDEKEERK